jgi:hypothetical protein
MANCIENPVDQEISKLSGEQQREFSNLLTDLLYDRDWCSIHNINYSDPDFLKAKEILYPIFMRSLT